MTDGNIKSFERVARKYNIHFVVKKDKTTNPPKYVIFFKDRDADAGSTEEDGYFDTPDGGKVGH